MKIKTAEDAKKNMGRRLYWFETSGSIALLRSCVLVSVRWPILEFQNGSFNNIDTLGGLTNEKHGEWTN